VTRIETMLLYQACDALENNEYQKCIKKNQEVLSKLPNCFMALANTAGAYAGLNNPEKSLYYGIKAFQKVPYPVFFETIAYLFALDDNKNEALFWLEKYLKSGIATPRDIEDIKTEAFAFAKYKNDPDFISLLEKYSNSIDWW